ncbi:MAG: cation diffusion facilitator family transporter [Bacteroidota bacterium]
MNRTVHQENQRLQRIALALGILLMAIKFIAWWMTNSNGILSDALESIINIVAGGFAIYSLNLSALPKDSNHPYGHGKIEFLSAGFEGGLIFLGGLAICGKSIYNLFFPQAIMGADIGMLLVALTGGCNYALGWWLERAGRRNRTMVLQASGQHLKTDGWTSLGLLVGLGLFWITQIPWIDNLTALIFGALILYTGFKLLRSSVAGIMDEADYQLINELIKKIDQMRSEDWIDVHNFRVIKYGGTLHIDCHLTVPWYYDVKAGHQQVKTFESAMEEVCDNPVELFIHVDPCQPRFSCAICDKMDCKRRKMTFQQRIEWNLKTAMINQQHRLELLKPQN